MVRASEANASISRTTNQGQCLLLNLIKPHTRINPSTTIRGSGWPAHPQRLLQTRDEVLEVIKGKSRSWPNVAALQDVSDKRKRKVKHIPEQMFWTVGVDEISTGWPACLLLWVSIFNYLWLSWCTGRSRPDITRLPPESSWLLVRPSLSASQWSGSTRPGR